MKKCSGCGSILQNEDFNVEGYVKSLESNLCLRCFRIKNYSDYKSVSKTNANFLPILKEVNKTNDLVLLVVDTFLINKDISFITDNLNNDILLVYTKRDILPLKVSDQKLLDYNIGINPVDKVIISSNKNYNMDLLYEKINKYKKSKNVYIVGFTNAGKSTLLNKIIYNYSNLNSEVTTSIMPSTTLNKVEINLNEDLTLIDTPGIIDENSIINFMDPKKIKKIMPNREIKPITYQVKGTQYIEIEDLALIEASDNNLTFFISNNLKIERFYKKKESKLKDNKIRVKENEDIVITGLGFIKVTSSGVINVKTIKGVEVYTRVSLI